MADQVGREALGGLTRAGKWLWSAEKGNMMEPALFLGITVDAVICVSAVRVVE